ncbi:MAG: glycosyltransferase [Prevotella multiformis]|uniref:glycosyltransferase n=1 Tax=Prevotella multiformis TaxID=282402 RepID=UPI003FA17FA2
MGSQHKKLLQINITANWGSHGKIAEGIGKIVLDHGWESYIAYGRWMNPSQSTLYHIGSKWDEARHGIISRLFDNHGLNSKNATRKLIQYIQSIQPDIIHLHNIHGYYLNYPILFEFLSQYNAPVVWTLHDCWTFTGHCAHYMFIGCEKWKQHCEYCPNLKAYPKSLLFDRSYQNFEDKRGDFTSLKNLTLVPVSNWLQEQIEQSFLKEQNIITIHNGIDVQLFKPASNNKEILEKYKINANKHIVLGIASNWYHKGLEDFIKLRNILNNQYEIVLVGLNKKEQKQIPRDIIGIPRTQNIKELVTLYSTADVYFNPTWEDNFPTTNLEAMACGTPIITYRTGGSPEAIGQHTGFVVNQGHIQQAAEIIKRISLEGKEKYANACRNHIETYFNMDTQYMKYFELYNQLLK